MKLNLQDGPAAGREIVAVKTHIFILVELDGQTHRYRLMGISRGVLDYSWDNPSNVGEEYYLKHVAGAAKRGERIPTFVLTVEKSAGSPESARA